MYWGMYLGTNSISHGSLSLPFSHLSIFQWKLCYIGRLLLRVIGHNYRSLHMIIVHKQAKQGLLGLNSILKG